MAERFGQKTQKNMRKNRREDLTGGSEESG